MGPLPTERFDLSEWSRARVNIDYHIAFDTNYYSVPYNLIQELVEVGGGRRNISEEIRELIQRPAEENPDWVARKIHGETLKLGLVVFRTNVARLSAAHAAARRSWETLADVSTESYTTLHCVMEKITPSGTSWFAS